MAFAYKNWEKYLPRRIIEKQSFSNNILQFNPIIVFLYLFCICLTTAFWSENKKTELEKRKKDCCNK